MRKFLGAASLLAIVASLALSPAEALYRFDDLYRPSGRGAQWMVITGSGATLGNGTTSTTDGSINPLAASGDLVSDRNSVRVLSGESTETVGDDERDIHTMFLAIPESSGTMTVDFYQPDATSGAVTDDVLNGLDSYPALKVSTGDVTEYGVLGKRYTLTLVKAGKTGTSGYYGSERGVFIFHQNPRNTPSQTLEVPFIVANVRDATAQYEPLIFRTTLRNATVGARGDIVAHDAFTWDVTGDKTTGGNQWVFVPVDEWPINDTRINYSLTTEVTNHTAVRYTAQRYDSYAWNNTSPIHWKFDLPRLIEYGDIPRNFALDELSHIAPGLTTVYRQQYNVNESMKRPLRLYSVDPATPFQELILNHKILFGLNLGSAEASSSSTTPVPYKAQAFNLRSASTSFLQNVANTMQASGGVLVPDTANFFSQSSIGDEYISGGVIRSFHVKQTIPASLRSNGTEGMLPLHVTFNLPRTDLQVGPHWDEMLVRWHETGDVHDLFAKYFSVFLLSRKDGEEDNPWDMVQELVRQGAYFDQVKVFMDEDREVITVSFIVMLMDGTRDGSRPALYLVEDKSNSVSNQFMIVRDGHADNTWNLVFYVAPAGYTENDGGSSSAKTSSSSSGGGCDGGFGAACLGLIVLAGMMWGRRPSLR